MALDSPRFSSRPARTADSVDLAPHQDSSLEWWYVQGTVASEGGLCFNIMFAYFRSKSHPKAVDVGNMLLCQAVDEATGKTRTESRMDRQFVDVQDHFAGLIAGERYPPVLRNFAMWRFKAVMQRLIRGGVLTLDGSAINCASDRLALNWNGASLVQDPSGLRLTMDFPDGRQADLHLETPGPWLAESSHGLNPTLGDIFRYESHPLAVAAGTIGGEAVRGNLWIDHQWGDYRGWFLEETPLGHRVLGWNWFGITLDGGRAILIHIHRREGSAEAMGQFAIYFDGKSIFAQEDGFTLTPNGEWWSPRTRTIYPVEWSVALPALEMNLKLSPISGDQEIPVYGIGAIWEGVVKVTGSERGQSVSGRGRVELVGYATVTSVVEHFKRHFGLAHARGIFGQ